MAVFFDNKVDFPKLSGGARVHNVVEWHSSHAILAVASKSESTDGDGSVNFFMDEVSSNSCGWNKNFKTSRPCTTCLSFNFVS